MGRKQAARGKLKAIAPHAKPTDTDFIRDRYIHMRVSNRKYRETLKREAKAEGRSLSNYIFFLVERARERLTA